MIKGKELGGTRMWLRRMARFTGFAAIAIGGAGAGSAGCLSRPIQPAKPRTTSTVIERLTQSSVDKIDLLLAIDNSRSMADKQAILAAAVPDLVLGLVNPNCINPDNNSPAGITQPASPLDQCPTGTEREFEPVLDIHIGIISSSIGGHGSDACPNESSTLCGSGSTTSNNDKAHLLSRTDPCSPTKAPTYQNKDFLAWDADGKHLDPPGETNIGAIGMGGLIGTLADMVGGTGQIGCGYEAQLESVYRFLADPHPYDSISIVDKAATRSKEDDLLLLQQRTDFMRPNSLLAIIMLTDENDCSIIDGGQYYFAAQQKNGDGSEFHLPKARSACATDPNDACCKSCGQGVPEGCSSSDPACTPGPLSKDDDNINLRCWDQKRRFGIDFLYPVERYVNMLTKVAINPSELTLEGGNTVPNPIFTDLNPKDKITGIRDTGLVFFAGIVGVPWQDISKNGTDLKEGFKTAEELATPDDSGKTTWDVILGDPTMNIKPLDPHMIESVQPRPGISAGDPISGNEWTIAKFDDLQYACIFPLPDTRDCTDPALIQKGCDCSLVDNDNPLCTGAGNTTQDKAKGYPGIRELRVLKAVGSQGITASVCPSQMGDSTGVDFGYRPAIGAIIARLKTALGGKCLPRRLNPLPDGSIPCLILEARHADVGCGSSKTSDAGCAAPAGRQKVQPEHLPAITAALADPAAPSGAAAWNCFCEIVQLEGKAKEACQQSEQDPNDPSLNGWCYIDATTAPPTGNVKLVKDCPETEKRIVRFIGEGEAQAGSTAFITCAGE